MNSDDRTAGDMVADMLSKGKTWIDILAVSCAARKGQWRKDAESILLKKGVMPKDAAVRNAQLKTDRSRRKLQEDSGKYEKMNRTSRRHA